MAHKEEILVQKEMETEILAKIKEIEQNILTGKGSDLIIERIQMLASINDELSDVLLNWDDKLIDSGFKDQLG